MRGARGSPVPVVGLAWLLVAAGVWAGIGLVPGIPLDALTWLALGAGDRPWRDARLDPRPSMPTYAVRAPLVRWLAEEARRAHADLGAYRLLDVGCGEMPYRPLFAAYAATYVGVDPVPNPLAELRGPIEALPVDDGSFDVVLCAQVLEHVDDPARGVRELHRVTCPGWPRSPLHARRDGLPPEPGRPLALDARRAGAALLGQRRLGVG